MLETQKQTALLGRLVFLTVMMVMMQWLILGIHHYDVLNDIKYDIIQLLFTKIIIVPLAQFFIAQLILYSAYVYMVWFVCISIGELFLLSWRTLYCLSALIWLTSVIAILTLNLYYVPHSFFTTLIRHTVFSDGLTDSALKSILIISNLICLFAILLTLINLCKSIYKKQHLHRQWFMLASLFFLVIFLAWPRMTTKQNVVVATNQMPNVFIISFDALRPDYLGFFNKNQTITPHFDAFLRNAVVFPEAYTPLSRTFPSWVSLLTARFPLHTHARDNNVDMSLIPLEETLPKRLQQAGYETIYASDDRRYNTIDQRFGFDHVVGPSGMPDDFLIGDLSDLPLSNLIATTRIGQFLFPYNYANHGVPHTYDPNNFLAVLNDVFDQPRNKPLFFAVHFDLSAWPFVWFNDKQAYNVKSIESYKNAVLADDHLLAAFLEMLKQKGLLQHAIVVLMSDHGITLGLHGDRLISEKNYQGNSSHITLRRNRYSDAVDSAELKNSNHFVSKEDGSATLQASGDLGSIFLFKNYGIDTSFGYGGDVVSLKQNHPLLAFRGYGVDIENAQQVNSRVLLLDVAPTLLDLLKLKALTQSEGVSLSPYLRHSNVILPNDRVIYLESGLALTEIEQQDIVAERVAKAGVPYFYINRKNYLLTIEPLAMQPLIENKERAILQGDWLLAYYPKSKRYKLTIVSQSAGKQGHLQIDEHPIPPFFVLVNLKTGEWTQESDTSFFAASPAKQLAAQLRQFYGKEMDNYAVH